MKVSRTFVINEDLQNTVCTICVQRVKQKGCWGWCYTIYKFENRTQNPDFILRNFSTSEQHSMPCLPRETEYND